MYHVVLHLNVINFLCIFGNVINQMGGSKIKVTISPKILKCCLLKERKVAPNEF